MKTNYVIIFLFLTLIPYVTFSQDGSPDLSFGNNGIIVTDIDGLEDTVAAVAQNSVERILVIGHTINTQNDYENFILAYLEDGSIDTSFGVNGILLSDPAINGLYREINLQSDDTFLIGSGTGTNYKITRFLPDGDLDLSFSTNGVLTPFTNNESGKMFLMDSDDKFIVMGQKSINSDPNIVLERFLPNGELDTAFGANGIVYFPTLNVDSFSLRTFYLQEDSKIVVNYSFTENGIKSRKVVRFLSDGTVDTSFGTNGIAEMPELVEDSICKILSFGDGSVLVSCSYFDPILEIIIKKMLKLSSDGILDENFGSGGYVNGSTATFIQPNQRIITDSSGSDWEGGIYLNLSRRYSNGNADGSFQFSTNYGTLGAAIPILLNSGKILVAGNDIWYNGPNTNIVLQQFNNNPLGISENSQHTIAVFPNPSEGIFNIKSNGFTSNPTYQITDVTGKVIQIGSLAANETTIDISLADSGMYFLRAANTTVRLIKN